MIKVRIQWDVSKLRAAQKQLRENMRMTVREFIFWRAKIVCQDLIRWTPPRGRNPGTESWPSMKKRGERSVKHNINRVFHKLTEAVDIKNPALGKGWRRALRLRDYKALDAILRAMGIKTAGVIESAEARLHNAAMDRSGKTWQAEPFLVIKFASIGQYEKLRLRSVGKAKWGWGVCAKALKCTGIPGWVTRHLAGGRFVDHTRNVARPYVELINDNKHIGNLRPDDITRAAINANNNKVVIELNKRVKWATDKFSK